MIINPIQIILKGLRYVMQHLKFYIYGGHNIEMCCYLILLMPYRADVAYIEYKEKIDLYMWPNQ